MKIGDELTIAGVSWTVRPFTPAEHERFDEIVNRYELETKAAELQALASNRGGTAREALLKADQKRLQAKLDALLDENGAVRDDLSDEERLRGYELAAELDELTQRLEAKRAERAVEALLKEEELTAAREAVVIEFMHGVLDAPMPLPEFQAALTANEIAQLGEVVALGKLPLGLSASMRRQSAMLERALAQATLTPRRASAKRVVAGSDSGSRPPRRAARRKRGRRGRSRKSSSRSKGGS